MLKCSSVSSVISHKCMYGLCDPLSGKRYKKATRLIGELPGLEQLACKCDQEHEHEQVISSIVVDGVRKARSEIAGAYPAELANKWSDIVFQACNKSAVASRQRKLKLLSRSSYASPR